VPPKSALLSSGPNASAGNSAGKDGSGARPMARATTGSGSGIGTAAAIAGGALVLLAGAAFLINRRWPLPDLMRRRSRP
jgi:D-alanyl-D-alanine carboxypeptidase (penicillin-binding protein 5/6)